MYGARPGKRMRDQSGPPDARGAGAFGKNTAAAIGAQLAERRARRS